MTLTEEFRSYAAECDRMVNYTRDPEGKAIWKCMAARWHRAAELEAKHELEQKRGAREHRHAPLRHGESELRWA
jgi:hypothetical protein